MHSSVPVPTLHLFEALDDLLIELLRALPMDAWHKQTLASSWTVRDIAAHLLDGNLRSISSSRDGWTGTPTTDIQGYRDLVAHLNALNASWVKAMDRLSPAVLIDLLSVTNPWYRAHLSGLSLFEPALYPVAWAGESESPNWFHIAREYTEKWHHQQQIRQAVGGPSPLLAPRFYAPYLHTSLLALPYLFRSVEGRAGDFMTIGVEGVGSWYLTAGDNQWSLHTEPGSHERCQVQLPGDLAWRLFLRQIPAEALRTASQVQGEEEMAAVFFRVCAVMV